MMFTRGVLSILLISIQFVLHAQQSTGRSVTLDSRYFIGGYSDRAVAQVGIELTELTTLAPQLIYKPDSVVTKDLDRRILFYPAKKWRNVGRGMSQLVLSVFLMNPFSFAYHEYGHGTRTAAVGYKPFYGHGSINSEEDIGNAIRSGDLYENFHSFYLASLFQTGGYAVATDDDLLFPPLLDEFDQGWDLVIAAGGLNNEMYFSERIERQITRHGGHAGYVIPYINSKLSTQQYASGDGFFNDTNNIVNYYQGAGMDIDLDDLRRGSILSLAGSTMSYQVIYSMISVLMGKTNDFKPLSFRGIEFPNTSFYMNREGISYKFNTGYQWKDWRFPVGFERVTRGDTRSEWTLGVEKKTNQWLGSVRTVLGEAVGMTAEVEYSPIPQLGVTGGYALYRAQNLRGQRVTPRLENGYAFHDIYFMVSWRY